MGEEGWSWGGVGREFSAAQTSCSWISRARSMSVPRKTFVKPFMEVMTAGGTDWERVWLTIYGFVLVLGKERGGGSVTRRTTAGLSFTRR